MKITKIQLPLKGKVDTWFITGDWHSYYCNLKTVDLLLKTSKLIPKAQRKLIINGDFMDVGYLFKKSPEYISWKTKTEGMDVYFVPEFEQETEWANKMLDILEKHFSEIIFLEGNHEYRLLDFKNTVCPNAYKHIFDVARSLNLRDRGIKHIKYNDWLDIGKTAITHGMFHGTNALKRHYEACGKSVIFGHLHRRQSLSFFVRGQTHMAFTIPCMSTLNPDYLKNAENNWSLGFGILNVINSGDFWFNILSVWNDMILMPDGKVIK